jgi:hypothetical protein
MIVQIDLAKFYQARTKKSNDKTEQIISNGGVAR